MKRSITLIILLSMALSPAFAKKAPEKAESGAQDAAKEDPDKVVNVQLTAVTPSWDGICPVCRKEKKTSHIVVGGTMCTMAACGSGGYDEKGVYVPPKPCNTCSTSYKCSNSHAFIGVRPSY